MEPGTLFAPAECEYCSAFDVQPRELARTSDPSTSHEAAEHLVFSGKLGDQMRVAFNRVTAAPGSTASELDPDGFGSRISKRLNDLAKCGLIEAGLPRQCSVTGRNAQTWWETKGEGNNGDAV